jgi:hypothetical protein
MALVREGDHGGPKAIMMVEDDHGGPSRST